MESPKNTLDLKIDLNVEVSILDEEMCSFSKVVEEESILETGLVISL